MIATLKYILKQFPFIFPKGIIYSTKKWIKKSGLSKGNYFLTRDKWYINLEEREFNQHNLPLNIDSKNHQNFITNSQYLTTKASLFYLTDVEVYGERGEILTNRNYLLQEFTHNFMITSIGSFIFQNPFRYFKLQQKKISGVAAILTSPSSFDYYHWIYDVLGRIHLYNSVKEQINFFVISNEISPFLQHTLSYFDINQDRIIKIDKNEKIRFDKLFVSSLVGSEGRSPKWSIQFLRNNLLPRIKPSLIKKKIFLVRGNVSERRLINEVEVETLLKKHNFESIDMGSLSFLQQLEVIHNSSIVVGLHGGAFSNLILAKKDMKVLEIFSQDYVRTDCFYTLSMLLELKYWYLIAEKTSSCNWGDAYIDLTRLKKIIIEIELN